MSILCPYVSEREASAVSLGDFCRWAFTAYSRANEDPDACLTELCETLVQLCTEIMSRSETTRGMCHKMRQNLWRFALSLRDIHQKWSAEVGVGRDAERVNVEKNMTELLESLCRFDEQCRWGHFAAWVMREKAGLDLASQSPKGRKMCADASTFQIDDHDVPIDVGIVVPLKEEFEQLHAEIATNCRPIRDAETHGYYYRFDRQGAVGVYRCVATFVGEMGETKASLVTQRLCTRWDPKTVVVLGIAAGISKDVMIGDVVTATLVDSYLQNSRAVDTEGGGYTFEFSGEAYRPSSDLVNDARHFGFANRRAFESWQQGAIDTLTTDIGAGRVKVLVEQKLIREKPTLEEGHVASGPTVAAAESFIDQVKKRDRKYLALEMESGGVLAAVYEVGDPNRSLVLRGISDLGDGRKEELDAIGSGGLRRYAVRNALRFLWKLLEAEALPKSDASEILDRPVAKSPAEHNHH